MYEPGTTTGSAVVSNALQLTASIAAENLKALRIMKQRLSADAVERLPGNP